MTLEERAKQEFKEWGSICRIYPKDKTFPITYDQLIDFASQFAKKEVQAKLAEAAEKAERETLQIIENVSDYLPPVIYTGAVIHAKKNKENSLSLIPKETTKQ